LNDEITKNNTLFNYTVGCKTTMQNYLAKDPSQGYLKTSKRYIEMNKIEGLPLR
jgi:hypothetical protein